MNLLTRRAPKKNLVYTVLFDAPDSESYRFLGKMLTSSLLRTFFTGDILVFRNSPAPLFLVERKGLDEMFLETPDMYGQDRAEFSWCWKYRVAELIDVEAYDKILVTIQHLTGLPAKADLIEAMRPMPRLRRVEM